ncbi:uncharacterized protein BCR38DRAFT_91588 [Pseudomassariella vexata]|uniref:Uncharacterized protein n=1 Tax=Pseudomassariella vexata TaxID=1141098 RepID=A0A1Y2EDT6_9PEZI|nr:uncharacterized protein BCR38DRAFT_91588 [Pseudomassariella vexata]ORY69743.1 hypothetical protein BCR38DRAFT_91588 [Pseudomassariella vexata]
MSVNKLLVQPMDSRTSILFTVLHQHHHHDTPKWPCCLYGVLGGPLWLSNRPAHGQFNKLNCTCWTLTSMDNMQITGAARRWFVPLGGQFLYPLFQQGSGCQELKAGPGFPTQVWAHDE